MESGRALSSQQNNEIREWLELLLVYEAKFDNKVNKMLETGVQVCLHTQANNFRKMAMINMSVNPE